GRVLVVSRIDAAGKRENLAAFNTGTAAAQVTVPTSSGSATWDRAFGTATATRAGSGRVALSLPPLSSALFVASAPLAVPAPAAPATRLGGATLSNVWVATATVRGSAPGSVTFAVKRGKGAWRRLAVDASPPYRGFLDPAKYRRNERLLVAAAVRTLDGRVAAS